MKNLLCYFMSLALTPLIANGQNSSIKFESGSWEEILAKSQSSGKLIFLDAYASWCGPCKTMEKETFTNQRVGEFYNTNFINARIDMENDSDGPFLSMKYELEAYPSLYFINPDGSLVYKKVGLLYADEFLAIGNLVKDEGPKINIMRQRYENGERSPNFLRSYIDVIEEFQLEEKKPILDYLKDLKEEELSQPENLKLVFNHVEDYNSQEFKVMLRNSEIVESQVGIKDYNHYIYLVFLQRVVSQLLENDLEGLEKTKKESESIGIINLEESINYGYAVYYLENREYTKALEYAKKLEKDPGIMEIDLFNNVAWGVYETVSTNDKDLLTQAKELTRKSLLASDNSDNNDTYASILYNLGETELAIEFMKRAVNLAEEEESAYFQDFKDKLEAWQENN